MGVSKKSLLRKIYPNPLSEYKYVYEYHQISSHSFS